MFRSRSPLGIEATDPPTPGDAESPDLKVLLTTLFEETESRGSRELIAEVDALVSGVVQDLHHDEPAVVPTASAVVPVQAERRERVAPWRTSAPVPAATATPAIRIVSHPSSAAPSLDPPRRAWLPIAIGAVVVAAAAWLIAGGNLSPAADTGAVSAVETSESVPPSLPPAPAPQTAATAAEPVKQTPPAPVRVAASTAAPLSAGAATLARPSARTAAGAGRSSAGAGGDAERVAPQFTPAPSAPIPAAAVSGAETAPPPAVVEPVVEWRAVPAAPPATDPARVVTPEPPPAAPRIESAAASPAPPGAPVDVVPAPTASSPSTPAAPSAATNTERREPRLLKRVMPVYPPQLLAARVGGIVRLGLTIDATGRVTKVDPAGGHDLLRREAVSVAGQWQYEPATEAGVPVESHIVVYLTFDPQDRRQD